MSVQAVVPDDVKVQMWQTTSADKEAEVGQRTDSHRRVEHVVISDTKDCRDRKLFKVVGHVDCGQNAKPNHDYQHKSG